MASNSYDKAFAFKIEIDGLDVAWFNTCSSIKVSFDEIEYRSGGGVFPEDISPGIGKHEPVTLTAGKTNNDDLYNWSQQVGDETSGVGDVEASLKKMVDIIQLDRDGTERRRWTLENAWPKEFESGGWDGSKSENVMDKVVLVFTRARLSPTQG